jgi:hypothetical protein
MRICRLTCNQHVKGSTVPQNLESSQAHQYFRINMICAIACANIARHEPIEHANSMVFFTAAVTCVEDVTSEVSPESLQALLLLIVLCLFYPRKGDLWKLLDYACRLSIELGYHTELDIENENEDQRNLRRSTFWRLYAIERIVGQDILLRLLANRLSHLCSGWKKC